jgi:hypothetical protein
MSLYIVPQKLLADFCISHNEKPFNNNNSQGLKRETEKCLAAIESQEKYNCESMEIKKTRARHALRCYAALNNNRI